MLPRTSLFQGPFVLATNKLSVVRRNTRKSPFDWGPVTRGPLFVESRMYAKRRRRRSRYEWIDGVVDEKGKKKNADRNSTVDEGKRPYEVGAENFCISSISIDPITSRERCTRAFSLHENLTTILQSQTLLFFVFLHPNRGVNCTPLPGNRTLQ